MVQLRRLKLLVDVIIHEDIQQTDEGLAELKPRQWDSRDALLQFAGLGVEEKLLSQLPVPQVGLPRLFEIQCGAS